MKKLNEIRIELLNDISKILKSDKEYSFVINGTDLTSQINFNSFRMEMSGTWGTLFLNMKNSDEMYNFLRSQINNDFVDKQDAVFIFEDTKYLFHGLFPKRFTYPSPEIIEVEYIFDMIVIE